MTDFRELFSSFHQVKVAVLGDFMLDTYWYGDTGRISPEAPVPVVEVKNIEFRIGGAGNVALNLARLGAQVSVYGLMGNDPDAQELKSLLSAENINTAGLAQSPDRMTTNKIRIISRYQHLLRLDREIARYLSENEEAENESRILTAWESNPPDLVILEDYNKGFLSPRLITSAIEFCKANNIPVAVDPKRKHFFEFEGCTLFKPNWKEVTDALNLAEPRMEPDYLMSIHEMLQSRLHHSISLITLGEHGMFCGSGSHYRIIPAHVRQVADVSGAGDTVIATAALVFARTGDPILSAEMANIAGGLVCEEVGTVPLNKDKFLEECLELLGQPG